MPDTDDLRSTLAAESLSTYRHCREAAAYLGAHGGGADTPETRVLLDDVAELCRALGDLLARNSPRGQGLAYVARYTAEACADALEPHSHDDASLRVAYSACRHFCQNCDDYYDGTTDIDEKLHEGLLETFPASDPLPPPTTLG